MGQVCIKVVDLRIRRTVVALGLGRTGRFAGLTEARRLLDQQVTFWGRTEATDRGARQAQSKVGGHGITSSGVLEPMSPSGSAVPFISLPALAVFRERSWLRSH